MARFAAFLFFAFIPLGLAGWTANVHPVFEVLRFAAIACLMASLTLFLIAYVRTPDVPGGDSP